MVEVYHGKAGADSLGENQTGKSDAKELKAFTYLIFWLTQQCVQSCAACIYMYLPWLGVQ